MGVFSRVSALENFVSASIGHHTDYNDSDQSQGEPGTDFGSDGPFHRRMVL
jgi:hypothetical protein